MSKHITKFTAQLVTFETTLPVAEVLTRLDQELNKARSGQIWSMLHGAQSKDEIVSKIKEITGDRDFLYALIFPDRDTCAERHCYPSFFSAASHSTWLNTYFGTDTTPGTYLYTLGNPLIAQTILQHDLRAGLLIPPRLLVLENQDHSGTKLIYHLPSSVMAISDDPQLKQATEALDAKLENFVSKIVSV